VIVGVPRETDPDETRAALVPSVAEQLVNRGLDVCIEAGAGERSDWADEDYRDAGCDVVSDRTTVFERADVVLQVQGLGATGDADPDAYRDGQVTIGLLGPYGVDDETLETLAERNVSAFALELIPGSVAPRAWTPSRRWRASAGTRQP
jgi:NAD(P) transhydrogenase subunit alpha